MRRDERRMAKRLGRPLSGLRLLEIGPGQGMERASYFGSKNTVLGMDLDVLPTGMDLGGYYVSTRRTASVASSRHWAGG